MRILNLGGGVQSTTLYLMALRGEIAPIECALFADLKEEPGSVYRHMEWLKSLNGPTIHVIDAGSLGDDLRQSQPTRPRSRGNRWEKSAGNALRNTRSRRWNDSSGASCSA